MQTPRVRPVSANATAKWGDLLLVNATTAPVTVTLPRASVGLPPVAVKKTDVSANAVIVTRAGTSLIDGATTVALAAQYDAVELVPDGVNWHIAARVAAAAGGSGDSAVVVLGETIVGVGGVASIDLTAIPATYRHLRLLMSCRLTTAAVTVGVLMRLNNDAGGNYLHNELRQAGATVAGAGPTATAVGFTLESGDDATTAGYFSTIDVLLANYAEATRPQVITSSIVHANGAIAGTQVFRHGRWSGTAAIDRITLFPAAANFAEGTVATLYGLKGA